MVSACLAFVRYSSLLATDLGLRCHCDGVSYVCARPVIMGFRSCLDFINCWF